MTDQAPQKADRGQGPKHYEAKGTAVYTSVTILLRLSGRFFILAHPGNDRLNVFGRRYLQGRDRNIINGIYPNKLKYREEGQMETRVAIIGIIIEDNGSIEKLNSILHEYGKYIIGRMGIPYRERDISIISIAIDAPNDVISALSGKLGKLPGVSIKAAYSKVSFETVNEVDG